MEQKKTHKEVKDPQISVQGLADYMAGSERGKRSVVQSCRYRAAVRVVQYNEGKLVCSNFIRKGNGDLDALRERGEQIRAKLADDDFTSSVNEHNADLVKRFADVSENIALPKAEVGKGYDFTSITVNGVRVSMRANLVFSRTTKTNKIRTGAMMFRYSKGRALPEQVGLYQSAGIFGFLRTVLEGEQADPERGLCVTLDGYTGALYGAPGNSVDIWNEMKAACATIAERWPNIPAPPKAIY